MVCSHGWKIGRYESSEGNRAVVMLTPNQVAVVNCVREGLTNTEVAMRLGVSLNTVKFHLKRISRTLGAKNRCAVVHRAQLQGLIQDVAVMKNGSEQTLRAQD